MNIVCPSGVHTTRNTRFCSNQYSDNSQDFFLTSKICVFTTDYRNFSSGHLKKEETGDLIEVFKTVKGFSNVSWDIFFESSQTETTRVQSWKLAKQQSNKDCHLHFFSLRVVNRWNSLSQDAVDATTVNGFKRSLNILRQQRMGFFMD